MILKLRHGALQVDGTSLDQLSHEKAVELFKRSTGKVRLVIHKHIGNILGVSSILFLQAFLLVHMPLVSYEEMAVSQTFNQATFVKNTIVISIENEILIIPFTNTQPTV